MILIRLPGHFRAVTWTSALALSLAAVVGLTALEGSALLVAGADIFIAAPMRTSVTDMIWCERQRIGVATFWTRIPGRHGRFEYSAALIAPDSPMSEPINVWPDLEPRRVVLAGPQGSLAIACADGSLHMLETIAADTSRVLIGRHPEGEPEALVSTADGTVLVSKGPDYLCAWDTSLKCLLWPAAARPIQCIAMHPDSGVLLCGRSDGYVEQRDARTGCLLRELAAPSGPISCLALFPDGRVASVTAANQVSVWRLDTAEPLWTASLVAAAPRSLSVSPEGRWLAVGALSRGRWRVICFDAATGGRRELAMNSAPIHGTLFTGDDQVFGWDAQGAVRLCSRATLSDVTRWLPGKAATDR